MSFDFSYSLRFMADAHNRFVRAGLAVALRVKNFDESVLSGARLGFVFTPSGGGGTTDIVIDPPPEIQNVMSKDEGIELQNEYKLTKKFIVSHTWVLSRAATKGYTDFYQVFRSKTVIGFVYDGRVYSIDSVEPDEVSGAKVRWFIVANAVERGATT